MSVTIYVKRGKLENGARMGEYTVGDKSGYTLEKESKIIKTGSYSRSLTWFNGYRVIKLEDKDDRTQILIHRGNTKDVSVSTKLVNLIFCLCQICQVNMHFT